MLGAPVRQFLVGHDGVGRAAAADGGAGGVGRAGGAVRPLTVVVSTSGRFLMRLLGQAERTAAAMVRSVMRYRCFFIMLS